MDKEYQPGYQSNELFVHPSRGSVNEEHSFYPPTAAYPPNPDPSGPHPPPPPPPPGPVPPLPDIAAASKTWPSRHPGSGPHRGRIPPPPSGFSGPPPPRSTGPPPPRSTGPPPPRSTLPPPPVGTFPPQSSGPRHLPPPPPFTGPPPPRFGRQHNTRAPNSNQRRPPNHFQSGYQGQDGYCEDNDEYYGDDEHGYYGDDSYYDENGYYGGDDDGYYNSTDDQRQHFDADGYQNPRNNNNNNYYEPEPSYHDGYHVTDNNNHGYYDNNNNTGGYDAYHDGYHDVPYDNYQEEAPPTNRYGGVDDSFTARRRPIHRPTEAIVAHKSKDKWVPASLATRYTPGSAEKWENDRRVRRVCNNRAQFTPMEAPSKRLRTGKAFSHSDTIRNMSAAGKHPVSLLTSIHPGVEFVEEDRERMEEISSWKFTASATYNGLKFFGTGVTLKIAKARAAINALIHLKVRDLNEMIDFVPLQYQEKQMLLETVINGSTKDDPWFIKVRQDPRALEAPPIKPPKVPTAESHPVMYLHQWYGPDIDIDFRNEHPGFQQTTYTCVITVQGMSFEGQGPSKKEAQKITAALILRHLDENPHLEIYKRGKKNKKRQEVPMYDEFA